MRWRSGRPSWPCQTPFVNHCAAWGQMTLRPDPWHPSHSDPPAPPPVANTSASPFTPTLTYTSPPSLHALSSSASAPRCQAAPITLTSRAPRLHIAASAAAAASAASSDAGPPPAGLFVKKVAALGLVFLCSTINYTILQVGAHCGNPSVETPVHNGPLMAAGRRRELCSASAKDRISLPDARTHAHTTHGFKTTPSCAAVHARCDHCDLMRR